MSIMSCPRCTANLTACSVVLPFTAPEHQGSQLVEPKGFHEGVISTAFCSNCGYLSSLEIRNYAALATFLAGDGRAHP